MVWAGAGSTGAGSVRAPLAPMARILVVDDQPSLAELIQTVLEEDGHAVEAVHGGQAALERIDQREYDLVICDLQMPDVDGAAVYRAVQRQAPPRPAVLLMTGYADSSTYDDFLQATGAAALSKPIGIDALRAMVTQQLSR
jgi:CheY-like chemotaxis protein